LGDIVTTGYTLSYNVYLGTDEAAVAAVATGNTTSPLYKGNVATETIAFANLNVQDKVFLACRSRLRKSVPPFPVTYTKGDVWEFTTGPAGIGVRVLGPDGRVEKEINRYIGNRTNNQAEYEAMFCGLAEALARPDEKVAVQTDSALVYNQLIGRFKVKEKSLKPLFERCRSLADNPCRWHRANVGPHSLAISGCFVLKLTDFRGFVRDGIGFITQFMTILQPLDMPPSTPPAYLYSCKILSRSSLAASR
jgi:hypothetical protein